MTRNRRTYIAASTFLATIATIALIGIPGQAATATHAQVTGSASCVDGLVNLAVTVTGDPGRDYRSIEAVIVSESLPTTPSIIGTTVKGDELVQSSTVVGLEYAATYTFEVAVQFANHAAGDLVTNRATITPTFSECEPPLVCPDGQENVDGVCVPISTPVPSLPPVDPPGCDPETQSCGVDAPCPETVTGVCPVAADPLVKTGTDAENLAMFAAAVVVLGSLLIGYGIRRRHQIRKA